MKLLTVDLLNRNTCSRRTRFPNPSPYFSNAHSACNMAVSILVFELCIDLSSVMNILTMSYILGITSVSDMLTSSRAINMLTFAVHGFVTAIAHVSWRMRAINGRFEQLRLSCPSSLVKYTDCLCMLAVT